MAGQSNRERLEKISNHISRRQFLEVSAKGIFATLVALALGNLQLQPVFASQLLCCDESGNLCPGCPYYGGGGPCPSGYVKCMKPSCSYCYYYSGSWTCQGTLVTCNDCWKNSNCSTACTCPVTTYSAPEP